MHVSDWLAIAALVASLCSLGISARTFMRDRYRLRFDGFILVTTGNPEDSFQLGVTVTNEGRRPASITEIYFETDLAKDAYPIRTPIHGGLPDTLQAIVLAENETHRFMSKPMNLSKMLQLARVINVCVKDSAGRLYRIPVYNDAYDWANTDMATI